MAKPSYTYELTYIVNATLSDEQTKDLVARINKYITDHDGELLECDEWGNRRLAFPLRKKRNGYYVNLVFNAPGDIIPRLERSLEIDDNVLRYLTLRMDAKMLRAFEKQRAAA